MTYIQSTTQPIPNQEIILSDGDHIEQYIESTADNLGIVELGINRRRSVEGSLQIKLVDIQSDVVLYQETVHASKTSGNKYLQIGIPPVQDSQGKEYLISIDVTLDKKSKGEIFLNLGKNVAIQNVSLNSTSQILPIKTRLRSEVPFSQYFKTIFATKLKDKIASQQLFFSLYTLVMISALVSIIAFSKNKNK